MIISKGLLIGKVLQFKHQAQYKVARNITMFEAPILQLVDRRHMPLMPIESEIYKQLDLASSISPQWSTSKPSGTSQMIIPIVHSSTI